MMRDDLSDLDGRDLLAEKTHKLRADEGADKTNVDDSTGHLIVEHYGHSGEVSYQRIVYHGDWRYVVAWGDDDELYNLTDDPYELENRLQDTSVADVLRKLQRYALDDLRSERAAREIEFPQTEMEFKLVVPNDRWPKEERLLE